MSRLGCHVRTGININSLQLRKVDPGDVGLAINICLVGSETLALLHGWGQPGEAEVKESAKRLPRASRLMEGMGAPFNIFWRSQSFGISGRNVLTSPNNQNEGYNSRINKILSYPWVLVCMLTKELIRAETEAL